MPELAIVPSVFFISSASSPIPLSEMVIVFALALTPIVKSDMLRDAFGDEVMTHYARAAEVEIEEFNQVVTDWEIARGFERA